MLWYYAKRKPRETVAVSDDEEIIARLLKVRQIVDEEDSD